MRLAAHRCKRSSQRLMARDDQAPCFFKTRVEDLTFEPPAHGYVEPRVLRVQLRFEPEALLRLGARDRRGDTFVLRATRGHGALSLTRRASPRSCTCEGRRRAID